MSIARRSGTEMVVSWVPLNYSEARGFISHYTVVYSPLTSGKKRQAMDVMTRTVPGMDSSTVIVGDLVPETGYSVRMSATNGAGTSPFSPVMTIPGSASTKINNYSSQCICVAR